MARKRKVTIPREYEEEVMQYISKLSLNEESKDDEEVKEEENKRYYEVSYISNHSVSKNGEYNFTVHYKGYPNGYQTPDCDCSCEPIIRTYFNNLAKYRNERVNTIYCICRVSSRGQDDPNHYSLDIQEEILRNLADTFRKSKNTRINFIIFSGSAYRKIPVELKNTIAFAESGDIILACKIDRLCRNTESIALFDSLTEKGVKIYVKEENIWYDKNKIEFIQGILDATKESINISKRVKLSVEYRKNRGDEIVGGQVPFGFGTEKDGNNRIVKIQNIKEQQLIKQIKAACSQYSLVYVSDYLNNRGITKRGKMWTPAMVRYINNLQ